MKEPTMKEVLELVEFYRDDENKLRVYRVFGGVRVNIEGNIGGSVWGSVWGDIEGTVEGTISGREWQFVETPKEKAIRLILEGKGKEAIKVLEEEAD